MTTPFEIRTLGEVAEFLDHLRVPVKESERRSGPYPYYGANGQVGYIDGYIFDEPLVLLAEDGGKFGSKEKPIAYKIAGKTWVNNHAHVLRAKNGCDTDYLHRVLSFYDVTRYLTGTTRQKLRKSDASRMPIALPPLSIQKQIAAVLEKADVAREKRREANRLTEQFLQSAFLEMFGDPVTNPKGWEIASVDHVAARIQYGYTESAAMEAVGPKFLRITDIQNGMVNWENVAYCKCPDLDKYKLREGDIVFARTGATTGKSFLVKSCPLAVFASYLIRLQVKPDVSPVYVYHFFQTDVYWSQIRIGMTGSTQGGFNSSKLGKVKLPVPPFAEQQKFAALVEKVESLRAKQRESEKELDKLFNSLMQRAFKGELVSSLRQPQRNAERLNES